MFVCLRIWIFIYLFRFFTLTWFYCVIYGSAVQIHTKSECSDVGTVLAFDQLGNITNSSCLARQKGTTVSIRNIFQSLPVRRKQFLANLKREFDRAVKYITSYCLICSDVHLSCYKIDKKCVLFWGFTRCQFSKWFSKQLVVSTNGSGGIAGNIESVYGVQQVVILLVP